MMAKPFPGVFRLFLILSILTLLAGCGGGGGGNGQSSSEQAKGDFGEKVYVAGYHPQETSNSGVVSIDVDSGAVTRILSSDGSFRNIAVSPDGLYVVFAEYHSGTIFLYNTQTREMYSYVTKAGARGIDITSDSTYAFVVSENALPTMTCCNLMEGWCEDVPIVTSTGGTFSMATDIVLTPDNSAGYISSRAYASGPRSMSTSGYNLAKATYLEAQDEYSFENIRIDSSEQGKLAITPDGRYLYSTNWVPNSTVHKVNLDDTSDVTVIDLTPESLTNVRGVAISPDGRYAYVTCSKTGYVSIIDTDTDEVVKTVQAGSSATDVAFTPDGRYAYVASWDVHIIDCETQELTGRAINVGFKALAVDITR